MASLKKIGFFWGEEKITVVELEKNAPVHVISSPLSAKASTPSPFSSNLTEEIQITAILQKLLQDNKIEGGSFYVSLPMKEIILRSFIIPSVKPDEIQNAIKFEAKKYMPFDIQDLSFAFHTIPFMENQTKRMQVIFFAARKEVLARYERIFKQVNATFSYCEPYMVSLSKALLFKKDIKPTDHLAFLILDKNLGRICFIDQGIPQFIREFPINVPSPEAETNDSIETLNLKIVNEVGNSFDFYARQFSGERIEQMLVSSDFVQSKLLSTLETELKVKIANFSPVLKTGVSGQINDMDGIYALGSCIDSPMDTLSVFNFLSDKMPKSRFKSNFIFGLQMYKEILYVLLFCAVFLLGVYAFFQLQLKVAQKQYDQLSTKQGGFSYESLDNIQAEVKQNTDTLTNYKNVRTKSDVAYILLLVASHLPQGAWLQAFNIRYNESTSNGGALMTIEMSGYVYKDDPNEEMGAANRMFKDFRNDKTLLKFINNVNLVSLQRSEIDGRQVTQFTIHCF